MNVNRLLHLTKTFAELLDEDIALFLRERTFRREHLNLEFKMAFQGKSRGRFDVKDFCKYVAGFSNEEGGIVMFGVADSIKNPAIRYPDYVQGLTSHPSIEDLSTWVTERIFPLVQSPAIRTFSVEGRTVIVLHVPEGYQCRPFVYVEPNSNAFVLFKKTALGASASCGQTRPKTSTGRPFSTRRRVCCGQRGARGHSRNCDRSGPLVATPCTDGTAAGGPGGLWACCHLLHTVRRGGHLCRALWTFAARTHRSRFAESLRYAPSIELFQSGISAGYFPRVRYDKTLRARHV